LPRVCCRLSNYDPTFACAVQISLRSHRIICPRLLPRSHPCCCFSCVFVWPRSCNPLVRAARPWLNSVGDITESIRAPPFSFTLRISGPRPPSPKTCSKRKNSALLTPRATRRPRSKTPVSVSSARAAHFELGLVEMDNFANTLTHLPRSFNRNAFDASNPASPLASIRPCDTPFHGLLPFPRPADIPDPLNALPERRAHGPTRPALLSPDIPGPTRFTIPATSFFSAVKCYPLAARSVREPYQVRALKANASVVLATSSASA